MKIIKPVLQNIPRNVNILAFTLGVAVGLYLSIVMPGEWSHFGVGSIPWFAYFIIIPAFFIFASLCIVTFSDFVSNYGTNQHWLAILWILSISLTMGAYGLGVSVLIKLLIRLRGQIRPSR